MKNRALILMEFFARLVLDFLYLFSLRIHKEVVLPKTELSFYENIIKVQTTIRFHLFILNVAKGYSTKKSIFMHCIFEGKYAISRENLANESLRNCDVRRVLCILTIFCRFKPKNVCILLKFSSFQLFQSKIILVKCCKAVIVPPE